MFDYNLSKQILQLFYIVSSKALIEAAIVFLNTESHKENLRGLLVFDVQRRQTLYHKRAHNFIHKCYSIPMRERSFLLNENYWKMGLYFQKSLTR